MDDDTSIELETIPSANIAQETDNPPKIFVFVKSDGVEEFKVQNETSAFDFRDQYCEDAIKIICKELKFTPKTFLNFGLKSRKSKVWLPSYQKLTNASAYEFRLRFHSNELYENKCDNETFQYYAKQFLYDLINDFIPDINYALHKNKIFGFCIVETCLRTEVNNVEEALKSYEKMIPKEIRSSYWFTKWKFEKAVRKLMARKDDLDKIKSNFIYNKVIHKIAPNYLVETYSGVTCYNLFDKETPNQILSKEEISEQNLNYRNANYLNKIIEEAPCKIGNQQFEVKIACYPDTSNKRGIQIFYKFKDDEHELCKFIDITNISVFEQERRCTLTIHGSKNAISFSVVLDTVEVLYSFVSCLYGHARLNNFHADICTVDIVRSRIMERLKELNCFYTQNILHLLTLLETKSKASKVQAFVLRLCDTEFDCYILNIYSSDPANQIFKVRKEDDEYFLYEADRDDNSIFHKVQIPYASIEECLEGFSIRFSPTPKLYQLKLNALNDSTKENSKINMENSGRTSQFNQSDLVALSAEDEDLVIRVDGFKFAPFRYGKSIVSVAKVSEEKFTDHQDAYKILLFDLQAKYVKIDSPFFLKLVGYILDNDSLSIVMENINYGPLDIFLRSHRDQITIFHITEASLSLTHALDYLRSRSLSHGMIRCKNLFVVRISDDFAVKLGDTGLQLSYGDEDKAHLPKFYHTLLEETKPNAQIDLYAYAMTLYEIFTKGKPLEPTLIRPAEDIPEIYMELYRDVILRIREYNDGAKSHATSENNDPIDNKAFNYHEIQSHLINLRQQFIFSKVTIMQSKNENLVMTDIFPIKLELPDDGGIITIFNSQLGEGGFGLVYLGELRTPSKVFMVAAKQLKGLKILTKEEEDMFKAQFKDRSVEEIEHAMKDGVRRCNNSDRQDFDNEAIKLKNLKHKNVVKFYTYSVIPLQLLITEYIEGSLSRYITHGPQKYPKKVLLQIADDICEGMVYLVTQSIVHCDLSTDNILMDNNYNIKITDFGLSNFMADFESTKKCIRESRSAPEIQKRIEEDDPENTKNVGKRNKQYKGTQNDIFTEKSDVFAYGIVLWELFSKKHANEDELRDYLKVPRDYVDLAMILKQPKDYKQIYNNVIKRCWHVSPYYRLKFIELKSSVDTEMKDIGKESYVTELCVLS